MLVAELLADLTVRATHARLGRTLTHGRFHPGHVFIGRRTVTVIDLDELAMAHPARDLGEFLARLSILARRARQDERARGEAISAFIRGYHEAGAAIPSTLAFHWSATLLGIMCHLIESGHPRLARRIDHCLDELRTIPERAALVASGSTD